jgi:hypothetical protein
MGLPNSVNHKTSAGSGGSLGLRLVWTIVGNAAALFALVGIVVRREMLPSTMDALYWGFVALVIGARFLDVRRYGGTTADGGPATLATWRRFALTVLAVALGAWGVAHGIAALLRG